jgi:RecJ-like exonuclease
MDCSKCGYKNTDKACKDCPETTARRKTTNCPRCGGTGMVLVDISQSYGNRAERRRAKRAKMPMEKYLPCPDCTPEREVSHD